MRILGVYGAAGCGRGVMPLVSDKLAPNDRAVFIDDDIQSASVNGYPCLTWSEFLKAPCDSRQICLAIADGAIRMRLDEKCRDAGVEFFSPRSDQALIMDDVEIGEGAILSPFVTFTSNIRIGRHFHANLYSYVEHDCEVGDFVTFAPGVKCNGNVVIEDQAYIGSGAVLRQGKRLDPLIIGKGAVVGMGAVVTKHVAPGAVVVGNPARPLEKR